MTQQQIKPVDRIEQLFVQGNIHNFWKAFDAWKFTSQAHEIRREAAYARIRAEIEAIGWQNGEVKSFCYDAFSMWGLNAPDYPDYLTQALKSTISNENWARVDDWNRGVIPFTKEHAIELAIAIERWNAQWDSPITEENYWDTYNHYHIGFWPATGSEHVIDFRVGRHIHESWQWS